LYFSLQTEDRSGRKLFGKNTLCMIFSC
jgi:hypothetical protein